MRQIITSVIMYPFVVFAIWFAWHGTGVVVNGGSGGEWHWIMLPLALPLTIFFERVCDLFRVK